MNFCTNDLKSKIVRLLHVAANYYEARRLMVVFADLQDLKNIYIPFAITRYEKRAIWTFFVVCLTESSKNWWGAPIGPATVLGSLGMGHRTIRQALLEL
jgi:hypothetical protein